MKKLLKHISRMILPLAALFTIGTAHAGWVEPAAQSKTHSFTVNGSGGSKGIKTTSVSYDTGSEMLNMSYKFTDPNIDSFWLVLSDGPNPKKGASEYAIMYGDLDSNRLSVYAYDTKLGEQSFKSGKLLASYSGILSKTGFKLDVTDINNAFTTKDWDGVQIGSKAGIWFHAGHHSQFKYGKNGDLKSYEFCAQSWVDGDNISTTSSGGTPVSEPSALISLATVSALAIFFRKKKNAPAIA